VFASFPIYCSADGVDIVRFDCSFGFADDLRMKFFLRLAGQALRVSTRRIHYPQVIREAEVRNQTSLIQLSNVFLVEGM
jgi:hypothetical protein